MGTDLNTVLDPSFDTLETAFSDESRKVVRQIKAEWQKIVKCRDHLSAREEELLSVKEKLMHLNEIKDGNEKYQKSMQCRIETLKQSNIQLKSKLSNLKKEDDRAVEKYSKEQEYMNKKLAFYEEKWRQRYETHYSQNPKVQEKERAIKELEEVRHKLYNLNENLQQCEKELFQAKCERNKRAVEESLFYPFNSFIINIAKIYLQTKSEYEECRKISNEISVIEKNIATQKSKPQMEPSSVNNMSNLQSSGCEILEKSNWNARKDFGENISSHNESENSNTLMNKIQHCNNRKTEALSLQMERDNHLKETEKKIPNVPKAQKWLEKLKIYIPKFSVFSTAEAVKSETSINKREGEGNLPTSKNTLPQFHDNQIKPFSDDEAMDIDSLRKNDNIDILKHTETSSYAEQSKSLCEAKAMEIQNSRKNIYPLKYTEAIKELSNNVDVQNIHTPMDKAENSLLQSKMSTQINNSFNLIEQQICSKNASKYFQKYDASSVLNEYLRNTVTEKMKATKSFLQQNMTKQVTFEAMDVDEALHSYDQNSLSKKQEIRNKCHAEVKKVEDIQQRISQLTVTSHHQVEQSANSFSETDCVDINLTNSTQDIELSYDQMRCDSLNIHEENKPEHSENKDKDEEKFIEQFSVAPAISNTEPEIQVIAIESTETTSCILKNEQPEQHFEKNETSNTFTIEDIQPTNASNSSPRDIIINSSGPSSVTVHHTPNSAICTQSSGSMPKTPVTKPAQSTAEANAAMDILNVAPFNAENSKSPGFIYTTRLMYKGNISNVVADSQNIPKEVKNNVFNPITYFNIGNNTNIPSVQSNKSDEDKNDFLSSAYEAYFNDSPPMMQPGKEKSMFAFADDSPELNDGPGGFFPLFAADDGESNKDSKDDNIPFMLNFAGPSTTKSPEESSGFKFLF